MDATHSRSPVHRKLEHRGLPQSLICLFHTTETLNIAQSWHIVFDAQAIEDRYGGGGWWGLLQMPFGDNNPSSANWPVIPIQFSKQYYAMMQVSCLNFYPNGCMNRLGTVQ